MAGYRESFEGNLDYAYGRGTRDIASHLERGLSQVTAGGGAIARLGAQARDARGKISDLNKEIANMQSQQVGASAAQWVQLQNRIDAARKSVQNIKKDLAQMPFDMLERGFAKVTKGLLAFNSGILAISFDFLIDSIKRVYELQERWTKAIGGFNMQIGGTSNQLKAATGAALKWSSTIRGLTNGDITEGIKMFEEFNDAVGSTIDRSVEFGKVGLQMARGFNLGGAGAGKLVKSLASMGDSSDNVADTMKSLVASANAGHESVNTLAKDVSEASSYMARFGKENQKMFVTAAGYARKYGISISEVQKAVEGFDMFDEATKTAAKLNTVFGTMINGMDLMMEDDPAKRLEMIRQQFLAQGQTFDKLTPKQRRYLSETLKLTEDQAGALLKAENAGESYADFQAKQEKQEKLEANAKKLMQRQLQSTTQTMYAFGVAFDRITVAIANAIKPLLKVFGLASDGDKKFKSFGEVMASVTSTVEHFFNSLAKNVKWNRFMEELGHDIQRAGNALKDFVMSGRAADLVGDIAKGMQSFYVTVRDLAIKAVPMFRPLLDILFKLSEHIKLFAAAWAGMKAFNMLGGAKGGLGQLLGSGLSKVGGSKIGGLLGSIGGRLGTAGAVGGLAGAIGGTGAGIGAGIGSLAGGFMGPIGMVLGPIVGGIAGKAISWILGNSKVKTALEEAHEELEKAIKREAKIRQGYSDLVEVSNKKQSAEDKIRQANNDILQALDNDAAKQKNKTITLSKLEADMLKSRASQLSMFGKTAWQNRLLLEQMGEGTKLTKTELDSLLSSASAYEDELGKLRETTKKQADLELARLQVSAIGQQKESAETLLALHKQEKKSLEERLSEYGGRVERGSSVIDTFGKGQTADQILFKLKGHPELLKKVSQKDLQRLELESKIDKLDMQNTKDEHDLIKTQTEFMRQQTIIQLKSSLTSSQAYLDFLKSDSEKNKGPEQVFQDYLNMHGADVISGFSQAGYDLLREGPNLGGVAKATASPNTSSPVFTSNFASQGGLNYAAPTGSPMMGQPIIIQNNMLLDGQKVGESRSVVSGIGRQIARGRP